MHMVQQNYRDNTFVIGISTEKMNGTSFTGNDTKAGDLLNLKMKGANGAISSGTPTHKQRTNCIIAYITMLFYR